MKRSPQGLTLVVILFLLYELTSNAGAVSPESSPPTMPGMPTGEDATTAPQATIRLSPEQRQMIGVTYGAVEQTVLKKSIRAVGRVDFDERRLVDVTLKIGGWVQDSFVDYTGKNVLKDEPLLTIYSPDLVTTQEEYLLALRTRDQLAGSSLPEARSGSQGPVEAAWRRLLLWDLTPQQIKALEARGKPQTYLTLYAPISGTVVEKGGVPITGTIAIEAITTDA